MTRELIAMRLWADVYLNARTKGTIEPEFYANEAVAQFMKTFPGSKPAFVAKDLEGNVFPEAPEQ